MWGREKYEMTKKGEIKIFFMKQRFLVKKRVMYGYMGVYIRFHTVKKAKKKPDDEICDVKIEICSKKGHLKIWPVNNFLSLQTRRQVSSAYDNYVHCMYVCNYVWMDVYCISNPLQFHNAWIFVMSCSMGLHFFHRNYLPFS